VTSLLPLRWWKVELEPHDYDKRGLRRALAEVASV